MLNGSAAIEVTKESGQVADTIVWENIVKMYSRMLPARWAARSGSPRINSFPELATMALSVGTGGSAVWLNNGVEGPPMTILGRPVIFTEKAPVVGDAGDITFVDFGYYLIGDRQVMQASAPPALQVRHPTRPRSGSSSVSMVGRGWSRPSPRRTTGPRSPRL